VGIAAPAFFMFVGEGVSYHAMMHVPDPCKLMVDPKEIEDAFRRLL
jgi:hypothetical protein